MSSRQIPPILNFKLWLCTFRFTLLTLVRHSYGALNSQTLYPLSSILCPIIPSTVTTTMAFRIYSTHHIARVSLPKTPQPVKPKKLRIQCKSVSKKQSCVFCPRVSSRDQMRKGLARPNAQVFPARSFAQGPAKNSNIFKYFQTFHTIFRIFSNVSYHFSNIFKRFRTFWLV